MQRELYFKGKELREKQRSVLALLNAGAPVEPGRFEARLTSENTRLRVIEHGHDSASTKEGQ